MRVFLRHGDDGKKPEHDPELIKEGRKHAEKLAPKLVKKYGMPELILVSPFQRTIQTAKAMANEINFKGRLVIDNRLSRYFNSSEQKKPKITKETLAYDPPIKESKKEFRKRVDKHIKIITDKYLKNVWVITHALVLKRVAKHFKVKIPDTLDFLEYFSVSM